MRRRPRKELGDAEVNLTPLIDVVFVILIMFIVVAPLLDADRISLAQGGKTSNKQQSVKQKSDVCIHVYGNNAIALNQTTVPLESLTAALSLEKKRHPAAIVQVFHDEKASFGTYQAVKNAVEQAGFAEMDVILKPR